MGTILITIRNFQIMDYKENALPWCMIYLEKEERDPVELELQLIYNFVGF